MRVFHTEIGRISNTFSFAYYPTALLEAGDRLADLYQAGFLPFSTSDHNRPGNFFMARQVRLDLNRFKLNSENRRVYKKFEGKIEGENLPLAKFNTHDRTFIDFCLNYFSGRHGEWVPARQSFSDGGMSEARLRFMLDGGLLNTILVYHLNGKPIAYVFLVDFDEKILARRSLGGGGAHFWYSFYDLNYTKQSLGLWLMIDVALRMKQLGRSYLYLGTAFGKKGLYKTNFDQIEWWDGQRWDSSRDKLRKHCRTDTEQN